MLKKLSLLVLVPILALSMVIISCGSDDDTFQGNPTYHSIQGVWYHNEGDLDAIAHTLHWFLATPSQAAVSDLVGATGVGSRTDFAFASMPTGVMFQGRYFNENAFRIVLIGLLNEADFDFNAATDEWEDLLDYFENTATVDEILLADDIFRRMFPTNFFGIQLLNLVISDGIISGLLIPLRDGDIVSLIPFSLNFHAFYGGAHIGRIHGFWVEFDDQDPLEQELLVTERFVVRHAENQLIPRFGLYSRIMPDMGT